MCLRLRECSQNSITETRDEEKKMMSTGLGATISFYAAECMEFPDLGNSMKFKFKGDNDLQEISIR